MEAHLQKKMRSCHERYLSTYPHASFIINAIGDALLERLSFIKLQPKRILDLGSGLGYLSRALSQLYPAAEVVAIDFTHTMNQQASKDCAAFEHIHLITADAYHLPIANHSIDLIVANVLLPALLDYPALWLECQRVLVPGGLLMFSNLGPDTLKELRASFAAIDDQPHVNTFMDLHDVGDGLLEIAFMDPVLDNEYFHLSYANLTALVRELKALGSIKFIGEPQVYLSKHAWQKIEQYYQKHFVDDKQRLLVTVEAYFGHAFNPLKKPQRLEQDGSVSIAIDQIKRLPL